jgi:hypothetical protein
MLISQWVESDGKRLSRKRPRGRLGGQGVGPAGHTLPQKILGFFPKFYYKLLNSLVPLILEIWKENFEKGNPNLGKTMLFRSCIPVDVIILTRENREHPLPRNSRGWAKGII